MEHTNSTWTTKCM